MNRISLALMALLAVVALCVTGCKYEEPDPFTEGEWFAGTEVDAATLTYGQEQYILYCYACHGMEGDGRGPASRFLRPPPRDLRLATYKFAKTTDGLPHDEDLLHILNKGLDGTAMLPWEDVPPSTMNAILQYIKTFSPEDEGWRDPDAELGERILAGADPWKGKTSEAIEAGKKAYHAYQCWSCHAAYASPDDIRDWTQEIKGDRPGTLRPNLYYSESKESELYTVGVSDNVMGMLPDLPCEDDSDCEGDGQKCVMERCEVKLKIKPPDFLFDKIRAGADVESIYRTIAGGIPGSGMPQWKGSVDDEVIWAVSHYVNWLTGWKDTRQAVEMKNKLRASAAKEPPPALAPSEPAKPAPAPAQ